MPAECEETDFGTTVWLPHRTTPPELCKKASTRERERARQRLGDVGRVAIITELLQKYIVSYHTRNKLMVMRDGSFLRSLAALLAACYIMLM